MSSGLTLKAGQKGTKELLEKYGAALLYVRYRYDEARGVRLKTVELVIEEKQWQPPFRWRDSDIVPVAVSYAEKPLREKLKALGGRWEPENKHWRVPYGLIRGTELEARIPSDFTMHRYRNRKKYPI